MDITVLQFSPPSQYPCMACADIRQARVPKNRPKTEHIPTMHQAIYRPQGLLGVVGDALQHSAFLTCGTPLKRGYRLNNLAAFYEPVIQVGQPVSALYTLQSLALTLLSCNALLIHGLWLGMCDE